MRKTKKSRDDRRKNEQDYAFPCKWFVPKSAKQEDLAQYYHTHQLVCGIGVAGSGKTYTTGMIAARMLVEGRVKQIVLTRPNVPTGRTLGHFPGDIKDKLAPWLAPITNVLKEGLGVATFEKMLDTQILIQPLETIRGMSFEDSFVIIDESQNLSLEEIKAVSTRIGEGTVMALIGDPNQSDVKKGTDLTRFVAMCNRNDIEVPTVEFTVDDCVRSDICGDLIRMFHKEDI
jgi:phosphate starvation-inducible PhoH-like protein